MANRILFMCLLLVPFWASAADTGSGTDDAQKPAPASAVSIDESANDPATCAAKWDRYHKSQECFAPYHNVNGTMKPGAFENCTEVKYPAECPLR
ncbi:hypothetical protein GALL_03530 [mine drainage metagenome]|uniref:Uncharacterized protein n=1 Tax=mine drainage metagenome TaxID=410659 RepID=A0A1J5TT88_9ZZZZ